MSDILTKEQVAEMLICEPSTVEEAARNRELPAVKFGRTWIFPREALMKRLNEIALQPKEPPKPPKAVAFPPLKKKGPPVLPDLSGYLKTS